MYNNSISISLSKCKLDFFEKGVLVFEFSFTDLF